MRNVVYTALFGDYDKLREPNIVDNSDVDFICFTNNRDLIGKNWTIVYVENIDGLDDHMMNRKYKFFPHQYLEKYDSSLYIDSNIEVIGNVESLFNKYLPSFDISAPLHSDRFCLYSEAEMVISNGVSSETVVNRQLENYIAAGYPKNNGLLEMNIILRNHNSTDVARVMDMWWEQISEYSKRDQLSFKFCCWSNDLIPGVMSESSRTPNAHFIKYRHRMKITRPMKNFTYNIWSFFRKKAYKLTKYDY